jgi:hypothetical protein
LQLQTGSQAPAQADVLDDLMLAVMLFNQFSPPRRFQWRALSDVLTQVNHTGLKLLREIKRMEFQIFDGEEHSETSAAIAPGTSPRKHARKA